MFPIVQAPQDFNAGYIPTNLELADELAKLETLQALRAAILEHRQLLQPPAAGFAAHPLPQLDSVLF